MGLNQGCIMQTKWAQKLLEGLRGKRHIKELVLLFSMSHSYIRLDTFNHKCWSSEIETLR